MKALSDDPDEEEVKSLIEFFWFYPMSGYAVIVCWPDKPPRQGEAISIDFVEYARIKQLQTHGA